MVLVTLPVWGFGRARAPALTADLWGVKNLGMNYGAMFTAWGGAGLLGPYLAGKALDVTGRYDLAFWLLAGLSIVGVLVVLLAVKPALQARIRGGQ